MNGCNVVIVFGSDTFSGVIWLLKVLLLRDSSMLLFLLIYYAKEAYDCVSGLN